MFTEKDIKIEGYVVDDMNYYLVEFHFSCNCDLLGIEVAEGEKVKFYAILNLITDEINTVYMMSEENYSQIHTLNIGDEEKKVLRNCAEEFIKNETGMTITQYLKGESQQVG